MKNSRRTFIATATAAGVAGALPAPWSPMPTPIPKARAPPAARPDGGARSPRPARRSGCS
ncbi:twin-arginine translocation signal domain-containing protein [Caulobacter segnis]